MQNLFVLKVTWKRTLHSYDDPVTLFLYRRRGDVFEPWLRQPTFLKTVQGEDVWIETYLKENRCTRERESNYSFRK
jgi:hypothetical protein